jgi:hypothetical protein
MARTPKLTVHDKVDKDADAVDEIVKQLETEKAKLARCQGEVIVAMFSVGLLLAKLYEMGKFSYDLWLNITNRLGCTKEEAFRYFNYGCEGLAKCSLGPASLTRLPLVWDKLEWISRLMPWELDELCRKLDPRTASRREVAYAVMAFLRKRGWAAERDEDPAE